MYVYIIYFYEYRTVFFVVVQPYGNKKKRAKCKMQRVVRQNEFNAIWIDLSKNANVQRTHVCPIS